MSQTDKSATSLALVWFRTDLRVHDNPALWHACQSGQPVVALYCLTETQWQVHGIGPRKCQLIKNRVMALKQQLADLNIPLVILNSGSFANTETQLTSWMKDKGVTSLWLNNEYEVNERKRDIRLCQQAKELGIEVHRYHDQCLIPPGEVLTKSQQMFKVFSPFKRAFVPIAEERMSAPLAAPKAQAEFASDQLERLLEAHTELEIIEDSLWSAEESDAHQQLSDFIDQNLDAYRAERDFPDLDHTSRLSVPLSIGTLSPRQCFHAALQANEGWHGGSKGAQSWISELIWREFYRHLLVAFPDLCKHKAFKPETESVPWRDSDADFQAWCDGKTGYPIVDAAQKQLVEQGWMHNRLRMISAMFLTKHLLIDWRRGEAFFNQYLLDADLASNNGGWQWSASTGADGAPYFRIFNPTTQSERYDPDGRFLAKYLPELAQLPASSRHQPNSIERLQCRYPAEIVEHKFARQRALDAFSQPADLPEPEGV